MSLPKVPEDHRRKQAIAHLERLKGEGNDHAKADRFLEAIEKYQAAIKLDPLVPSYHSNLAHCTN